ncbi:hypothetical protein ACLOJK_040302 [Asimina triloba]
MVGQTTSSDRLDQIAALLKDIIESKVILQSGKGFKRVEGRLNLVVGKAGRWESGERKGYGGS